MRDPRDRLLTIPASNHRADTELRKGTHRLLRLRTNDLADPEDGLVVCGVCEAEIVARAAYRERPDHFRDELALAQAPRHAVDLAFESTAFVFEHVRSHDRGM